jgi:hypothetical protein
LLDEFNVAFIKTKNEMDIHGSKYTIANNHPKPQWQQAFYYTRTCRNCHALLEKKGFSCGAQTKNAIFIKNPHNWMERYQLVHLRYPPTIHYHPF